MSNIVVTGANRGIGFEIARRHIERGDTVIAGVRNPNGATALADLKPAAIHTVDVSDELSVAAFGEAVTVTLAGGQLDVLYNNAGTSTSALGVDRKQAGVLDVSMDVVEQLTRINGLSAATVSRCLVPAMGEGSKIVNISSQLGSMVVSKMLADLPYNVSKAVMNMVTVQLAARLQRDGISAVCFHPGWVRTDMGGEAADLSPEESAAGIVATVDGLTDDQNGGFFRHDGSVHPW